MVHQLENKLTEYTIRAAIKDDAETYKSLRLRALKNNPEAFGRAYEESVEKDIDYFRQRIPEKNNDSLLLLLEKNNVLVEIGRAHV